MSFESQFGEKIRAMREDADLLQSDMAKLIPMNQSNYSKIERGVQEPSLSQLRRICQILRLDPRYLLELDGYEPVAPAPLTRRQKMLLLDVEELIRKYQNEK